jgi:predicted acetyltransferase
VNGSLTEPREGQRLFVLSSIEDRELVLKFTELAPHRVHKVPTYYFRMLQTHSEEELGSINLRVGSTAHIELYAGRVGFAVHPAYRGNRYASRSLRLLMPFARKLQLNPLWITCDPREHPITPQLRTCRCEVG